MTNSTQTLSGELVTPRVTCHYHEEPRLVFGCGREHVSPQAGISIFGPRYVESSTRHPATARIGLIGSGRSVASAEQWITNSSTGVAGDGINLDFPGYQEDRGFFTRPIMDTGWRESITTNEMAAIGSLKRRRDKFVESVKLVSDKMRLLAEKESEPQVIVLALPDELLKHCRTVDYRDDELGSVHRDFRRAIKAEAMRYRVPTQILLQHTSEATPASRNVDHRSRCAWNFFTGLHYKVGGTPWGPKMKSPGTLYIGVSFFPPLGSESGTMQTSVAQAFDDSGEGIVLRGKDFQWDQSQMGNSPHLDEEQAQELITEALKRYQDETKQTPRRVVIHKSSRYWPGELLGFQRAVSTVPEFDLVSVWSNDRVRLLRQASYPALRGTQFSVGEITYLYTTGYIPSMRAFPHGHVPSPLQIADHHGDASIHQICAEILALTKLNWNSAFFAAAEPITLKFSRAVSNVMREIPPDVKPLPQFKFYI
ncbi:hypothetical protein UC8_33360 [Roseimaritima ulvae]|uniref:Protein argonaute n=1 Tax=Roseimaritima ulvae TaxID=980254 RepID=A0A5B9QQE2_9BACT|nr:hypothetical protein UC8_33360 [Roseimaritima ulvae]